MDELQQSEREAWVKQVTVLTTAFLALKALSLGYLEDMALEGYPDYAEQERIKIADIEKRIYIIQP